MYAPKPLPALRPLGLLVLCVWGTLQPRRPSSWSQGLLALHYSCLERKVSKNKTPYCPVLTGYKGLWESHVSQVGFLIHLFLMGIQVICGAIMNTVALNIFVCPLVNIWVYFCGINTQEQTSWAIGLQMVSFDMLPKSLPNGCTIYLPTNRG